MKRAILIAYLSVLIPLSASAQQSLRTRNVILVTLDGVRWQEVFTGVDSAIVHDTVFTPRASRTAEEFWTTSPAERRRKIMPFLWSTVAERGQLYGNRLVESRVDLTNRQRFSYPGYSEILTGFADTLIKSNDKVLNRNRTVLEFLNEQPQLRGRVAAFASWDVFPYIINEQRSGIPVNAGLEPIAGAASEREQLLNRLLAQLPPSWPGIRHDALTFHFAFEHLRKAKPRVLYIALDETDDFAHDKKYHEYIRAARRADAFIAELWQWAQSTEGYRDATTLIITTDHGRGDGRAWTDHWTAVQGAQHVWLAIIGPDTPPFGEQTAGQYFQNQIARTIAALLGHQYGGDARIGDIISPAIKRQ